MTYSRAKQNLFPREFWIRMLVIAFPIVLQNLLIASFRMVDTVFVGQLGDTFLAAIGLAGNVSYWMEMSAYGVAAGAAVFMTQYHGACDEQGIYRTFSVIFLCVVPLGIILSGVVFCAPRIPMTILTTSPDLIEEGAVYLRTASFSYLALALSQIFCVTFRSTEELVLPMVATVASALTNIVLDYVLIFGKLGLAPMGIAGAGVATSVASWITPLVIFLWSVKEKNILLRCFRHFGKAGSFFKEFWTRALPVLCNETFYGLSVVIMNMFYGRMGDDNFAALTIYRSIENLLFVFFQGICTACNVMIGKDVGAGQTETAHMNSKRFILLSPLLGLITGSIVIFFRKSIVYLFGASAVVGGITEWLLIIYGIDMGIKYISYILATGVFRASGDTKIALVSDLCVNYFLLLPIIILGYLLKLDFVLLFVIINVAEDISRNLILIIHWKRGEWIKPVTLPEGTRTH